MAAQQHCLGMLPAFISLLWLPVEKSKKSYYAFDKTAESENQFVASCNSLCVRTADSAERNVSADESSLACRQGVALTQNAFIPA